MKKIKSLILVAITLPAFTFGQTKIHLTSYVNPLIGTTVLTDSAELGYNPPWRTWNGLVGPAASVPFGMMEAVPVTTYGSGSGYEYEVKTIKSFAQLRRFGNLTQLSHFHHK